MTKELIKRERAQRLRRNHECDLEMASMKVYNSFEDVTEDFAYFVHPDWFSRFGDNHLNVRLFQ